jgi:5-methyltetrahydropteroyltriglutamate--homocysteine methyltransferase
MPALESVDEIKRRTREAARYIDLDRLAISPQCGFASTVAGNPVSESDERAKLKLCVDAAKEIWG